MEHDKAHFQDTIKLKDQKILFLHPHIAHLTQTVQLALPPSEGRGKKEKMVAILEKLTSNIFLWIFISSKMKRISNWSGMKRTNH
jgi:hypothetical protein